MGAWKVIGIIALILTYLGLVMLDLGFNLISLIPVIGGAFETLSEMIIELASAIIVIILAIMGVSNQK